MSDLISLSATASPLRPFAKALFKRVPRLHAERQAGLMLVVQPANVMDNILNGTLNRLRGGNVEEVWWRNILDWFGQKYVAPDFLMKPALQEWLADEQVATDFKTLATTHLMIGLEDNRWKRKALFKRVPRLHGEAASWSNARGSTGERNG